MKPLAKVLDILQCEKKAYMGYLLPSLQILTDRLEEKRATAVGCEPLIDALLAGIGRRFEAVLKVMIMGANLSINYIIIKHSFACICTIV